MLNRNVGKDSLKESSTVNSNYITEVLEHGELDANLQQIKDGLYNMNSQSNNLSNIGKRTINHLNINDMNRITLGAKDTLSSQTESFKVKCVQRSDGIEIDYSNSFQILPSLRNDEDEILDKFIYEKKTISTNPSKENMIKLQKENMNYRLQCSKLIKQNKELLKKLEINERLLKEKDVIIDKDRQFILKQEKELSRLNEVIKRRKGKSTISNTDIDSNNHGLTDPFLKVEKVERTKLKGDFDNISKKVETINNISNQMELYEDDSINFEDNITMYKASNYVNEMELNLSDQQQSKNKNQKIFL